MGWSLNRKVGFTLFVILLLVDKFRKESETENYDVKEAFRKQMWKTYF